MASNPTHADLTEGYPALLVEELPHGRVRCHTCLRRCVILPGGRGGATPGKHGTACSIA